MHNLKIHISWLFLLVNPFLSIISNIYTFIVYKRISFYTLSISISIIYMYFPLPWDAIHNYQKIFIYKDGFNLYQETLYYATNIIGFSYIHIIFIYALISSLFVSKIINYNYNFYVNKPYAYLGVLICYFLVIFEFRNFLDLNKTFLSIIMIMVGLDARNKIISMLSYSVSFLIHPLMVGVLLIILIAKYIKPNLITYYGILIIAIIIASDLSNSIINSILNYGIEYIPSNVSVYLGGVGLAEYSTETLSLLLKIIQVGSAVIICLIFARLLKSELNEPKKYLINFIALLASLTCLLSFNHVAFERYYMATIILSVYVVFRINIDFRNLIVLFVAILINVGIFGVKTMTVMFSTYDYYVESYDRVEMAMRPLYYPTILLLNFDQVGQSDEILINNTRLR